MFNKIIVPSRSGHCSSVQIESKYMATWLVRAGAYGERSTGAAKPIYPDASKCTCNGSCARNILHLA